ncbi:lipase [Lenzites betulinus]|nr:lipase [Lenzites betulinus]
MTSSIMFKAFVALLALSFSEQVAAFPTVVKRQTFSVLSDTQIASYKPYTNYASTAYCKPATTLAWNCGANCNANPGFVPVASGGNGLSIQFWYVGYDPTLGEVIVGHQGTNTSAALPILEDISILQVPLNSSLFPNTSSDIFVHSGFSGSQARSASAVLAAVKTALTQFSATKVTVTGHSLGAAIGLLDSAFLYLQLPKTTTVRFVGYGMPRVGNQSFANWIDSIPVSVTHVNNKKDPVPILPGRFIGYHHPSGEVHIQASEAWVACPGQDNTDAQCIVGDVPTLLQSDADDHDGLYDGIHMGCAAS